MTLGDRGTHGLLSALFGLMLGGAAWAIAHWLMVSPPSWRGILIFSGVFFFVAGIVRGPDAGSIVGTAVFALFTIFMTANSHYDSRLEPDDDRPPGEWTSVIWLAVWAAGAFWILH